MIKLISQEEEKIVSNILRNDIFQNVYLYIDSILYGFNVPNIKTCLLKNNDDIKVVIYHYYNSIQLFFVNDITEEDTLELSQYILNSKCNHVSGIDKCLKRVYAKLKDEYNIEYGWVMQYNKTILQDGEGEIPEIIDYKEISELICSDDDIGGHYSIEELEKQLIERRETKNCKNIIMRDNGKIIAHAATYADCDKLSVIGGVITDPNYRNKGYARKLLNKMVKLIQLENKTPILFTYKSHLKEWYEKLGWEVISTYSKLEKIKKDI